MKKKIISISISEELYRKVKTEADKLGLTLSAYITLILQKNKKNDWHL